MKNNIYTCLEIGSYEIKILVCNLREERLFVLAQKTIGSVGIDRGKITNFDKLVGQIKKIKELTELDLKISLKNVILSVAPLDVLIENIIGRIDLDVKHPIASHDVRRLFRSVMEQTSPEGYLPIGIIPRIFKIDENHVVQNPRELTGMTLGIEAGRVLMPTTGVSNVVFAVESAGFIIDDTIVGSLAETLLTLTTPERYARTCYINIGHTFTSITIVNDGKIIRARTLLIGGNNITSQIAEKFGISTSLANGLKEQFGKYLLVDDMTHDSQVIHFDESNELNPFITRSMLNEEITKSTNEVMDIIKTFITEEVRLKESEYHFILAGGTAELPNIGQAVVEKFQKKPTIKRPSMLGVRNSKFTNLIGTAILAHELALLVGNNEFDKKITFVESVDHDFIISTSKNKKSTMTQKFSSIDSVPDNESFVADEFLVPNNPELEPDADLSFEDVYERQEDEISQTVDGAFEESYMDQKLENSGVLVRFFDRIFNETDE